MSEFNEEDARSLTAKLVRFELSDGERAALDAVFDAVDAVDVEGFATRPKAPAEERYLGTLGRLLGSKSLITWGGDVATATDDRSSGLVKQSPDA